MANGNTYIVEMMATTLRIRKLHGRRSHELNLVGFVDLALGQLPLL